MSGERRFGASLFGFNKSDVNYYFEKILNEFDSKIREKDDEISILKAQLRELRAKYEELQKQSDEINDTRSKIADVLIKAQEQAEFMIENAKLQALEEKRKLDHIIEQEKEKLVDIKEELRILKSEIVGTLKKYEGQLDDIIDEQAG